MIELSLLTAGAGLVLSAIGKKEDTTTEKSSTDKEVNQTETELNTILSEKNQAEDKTQELKESSQTTTSPSDPRDGEMYFGKGVDGGKYDPFYDYSNDPTYNTPYSITGMEMVKESLSRAYRARIIAPFLAKKDVSYSEKYSHPGFMPQQLEVDEWEHPIPALPMVKGSYSVLDMIVEVFNPFDFAVPLQKMRIGNMSLGGKRIYPIPYLSNSAHLNATGAPFWWRNLSLTPEGLGAYWANYLLRCELSNKSNFTMKDDNAKTRKMSMNCLFRPTDFEVDLVANSVDLRHAMRDYSGQCKGAQVYTATLNNLYTKALNKYKGNVAPQVLAKYVDEYYGQLVAEYTAKMSNYSTNEMVLASKILNHFGEELKSNSRLSDTFKPLNSSASVSTITSKVKKTMEIPARSSVWVRVRIPVADIAENQTYAGFDYIWNNRGKEDWGKRSQMEATINQIDTDSDDFKNMDQFRILELKKTDGLDGDDLWQLRNLYGLENPEREGGFLFINMKSIGDIREQDLRMAVSFYSEATNSVIQNHLSKQKAKIENTRVFDLGAYRGGRPSGGAYEWEKTYWESYPYFDYLFEANEFLFGEGAGSPKTEFFWDFENEY